MYDVGEGDGDCVGLFVVGDFEGLSVGDFEGLFVVGDFEGFSVGDIEGLFVVGDFEGPNDVGELEGFGVN